MCKPVVLAAVYVGLKLPAPFLTSAVTFSTQQPCAHVITLIIPFLGRSVYSKYVSRLFSFPSSFHPSFFLFAQIYTQKACSARKFNVSSVTCKHKVFYEATTEAHTMSDRANSYPVNLRPRI